MKLIIFRQKYFFTGILFLLFYTTVYSQELADLRFAEYLYNSGHYYDAITEYKRILYFKTEPEKAGNIFFKIGMSYKKGGFFDNSLNYISQAIENETEKILRNYYQFEYARVLMKKGDYITSKMELEDLVDRNISASLEDSVNYFIGWSEFSRYKWRSAEKYFENIKQNTFNKSLLFKSCSESKRLKYKSPVKAIILSTFIPGAGQIYSGKLLDGIIAFALNTGIIYYLADSIIDKRYTDSALIYYFLFARFYPANRANAYKYAAEYNIDLDKNFVKRIKNSAGFEY